MTLTPEFLPVGSIVNKNGIPHIITAENIKLCEFAPRSFNLAFKPIELTPEILTEWCGAKEKYKDWFNLGFLTLGYITRDDVFQMEVLMPTFNKTGESPYNTKIVDIPYLHTIQEIYKSIHQECLLVQIK